MSRTSPRPPRRPLSPGPLLLALATLAWAGPVHQPLHGQTPDRDALLAEARSQFDDTRALELLVRAADPSVAPRDSTWAVAIHDLAFTLIRLGDEEAAALWLRWAARHAPEWPLDREWFPPAVATLWDRARLDVAEEQDHPGVEGTAWNWEGATPRGVPGSVELTGEALPAGVRMLLEGPGGEAVQGEGEERVEPGSYNLQVTAEGYEPLRVEREVLPGVRTLVEVELVPSLSGAARAEARDRTAVIRWAGGGGCRYGVVVGDGRSVLTSLRGLDSRSGLQVAVGEVTFDDVSLVRADEGLDLALLRLTGEVPGLGAAAPAEGSRYGWVAPAEGCEPDIPEWTRLEAGGSGLRGTWTLQPTLTAAALGAPLLDPRGGILGVVTGGDRAVPLGTAAPLIRGPFAAGEVPLLGATTSPPRQGLPWVWIGTGVGLAGVAAALVARLAGGDGDGPGRGTVVITFPGG